MASLVKLPPLTGRRLPRRVTQLYLGLVLYGVSMALLVESTLGLDPWDVLHQGLAERTGLRFGWIVIAVSIVVLLAWIPLRQKPGFGTLSNAVVIGLVVDGALALLPTVEPMWSRWIFLISGIVLNGVATGLYIGARLGPGPRDGLMTGLAARGHSIRVVRTVIEVAALAAGWLLGGTVGLGTVLYAVAIGPLAHVFIPLFTVSDATAVSDSPDDERADAAAASRRPAPDAEHAAECHA
ncbi:MAG: YczE/YyaS/YitT family protein [Micromonosporaceae bacterium]